MRKVILQEFVTVDGMAAGPDGSVDFVPASNSGDQRFGQRQIDFMDSIDAILLGRVTYEMFAGYWPNVAVGAEDKVFADKINATPKIVFSRTLKSAPWGSFEPARIVKTSPAEELARLKQGAGKDMVVWGSISLAQALLDDGAIDEVQLVICPLALGGGRTLFGDRTLDLKLAKTETFERGSALLTYKT